MPTCVPPAKQPRVCAGGPPVVPGLGALLTQSAAGRQDAAAPPRPQANAVGPLVPRCEVIKLPRWPAATWWSDGQRRTRDRHDQR